MNKLMSEKTMDELRQLASLDEVVDYTLDPGYVATRVSAALRYIEALEADYKRRGVQLPGRESEELTEEEIAEMTGYKCPVCKHHELCTTPNLKPLCGESYTHFEPREKEENEEKMPAYNPVSEFAELCSYEEAAQVVATSMGSFARALVNDIHKFCYAWQMPEEYDDEKNFDSSVTPVRQLTVTSGEGGPVGVRRNAKYHCFVDDHALCNGRHQNTEDFDDGITIESATVLEQPHLVCKKCLMRWKRMFQIEG